MLSFSAAPILDHAELSVEQGERLCLVGRNGTGKSTLLRVIAGKQKLDDGIFAMERGAILASPSLTTCSRRSRSWHLSFLSMTEPQQRLTPRP